MSFCQKHVNVVFTVKEVKAVVFIDTSQRHHRRVYQNLFENICLEMLRSTCPASLYLAIGKAPSGKGLFINDVITGGGGGGLAKR